MITEQNIIGWAERYLEQGLSEEELLQLNRALDTDPELFRQWKQTLGILRAFESGAERKEIRNLIRSVGDNRSEWKAEEEENAGTGTNTVIPFRKYLRTTAAAAGLILFSSLTTMFFVSKKNNKVDHKQYIELVRQINTIKDSQSKIIDSLNKEKGAIAGNTEEEIATYGGTGFAISNDGYVATNYHVVKGANAIYIQTHKGETLKAYLVAQEPSADLAILKVENKNFRFGKTPLPYTIAKSVSGLGQKVFTIGYPKDEVVYNEGYISCDNGYEGDAHSYQLEITANPGQSGSPVLDKYGSVIALITGKQSNTSGTTFAVHSAALLELIHSLPNGTNIRLADNNKLNKLERTEQVKKLRDYVFSVKVN
jgi:serine protease Do